MTTESTVKTSAVTETDETDTKVHLRRRTGTFVAFCICIAFPFGAVFTAQTGWLLSVNKGSILWFLPLVLFVYNWVFAFRSTHDQRTDCRHPGQEFVRGAILMVAMYILLICAVNYKGLMDTAAWLVGNDNLGYLNPALESNAFLNLFTKGGGMLLITLIAFLCYVSLFARRIPKEVKTKRGPFARAAIAALRWLRLLPAWNALAAVGRTVWRIVTSTIVRLVLSVLLLIPVMGLSVIANRGF